MPLVTEGSLRKEDINFTHTLWVNCDNCSISQGNNDQQIRILELRKEQHPEEKETVDSLLSLCQRCFDQGRIGRIYNNSFVYLVGMQGEKIPKGR